MYMKNRIKPARIGWMVLLILASCNSSNRDVEPGTYFNDLFMGNCHGFTGGDGTYSVLLPDGRTAWIFGDTFIGGVNEDNTRRSQDPMYIRNSVVLQDGDSVRTLYQIRDGRNASFAIPSFPGKQIPETERWLWPGDGFIENDLLKIFYSEFTQQDTGMWGFRWEGTWIGSYSLPDLEELELEKLYGRDHTPIHFGHAVHVDEHYTYVYGAGEEKYPYAARFLKGDVSRAWEFYDGSDWSNDIRQARPMEDINVSEQFSVFRLKDIYILLTQSGALGTDIFSYTSTTPYGPWSNAHLLYTTPLPDSAHNLFTYNALAHPQFIRNQKLLVSYNTNSTELADHFRDASIYRPRFIRVPLEKIDSTLIN